MSEKSAAARTRSTQASTRRRSAKEPPVEPAVEQAAEAATGEVEPTTGGPGRLSVPVLVPEMHLRRIPVQVRHLPVPVIGSAHLPQVPGAVRARLPEVPRNRLLWWGGLAGLAAFGVIDWPVAGVVAAGTYIATRGAKEAAHEEVAAQHEKAYRAETHGG